jgi:hypothetical protein
MKKTSGRRKVVYPILTAMACFLAACGNTNEQISSNTSIIEKPKIEISQKFKSAFLDKSDEIEVRIVNPKIGQVDLEIDGGTYIDLETSKKSIYFDKPGERILSLNFTPRHATESSIIVVADSEQWQEKSETRFQVNAPEDASLRPLASREKLQNGLYKYQTSVEFHRTMEKARLAKNRSLPLEGYISKPDQSSVTQYVYNTGSAPLDAAQLDELPPAPDSSTQKTASSKVRPQGLFCGAGPIQTVTFTMDHLAFPGIGSSLGQGVYPLKNTQIKVYDDNGGWRSEVASGFLDQNGSFSFTTPGCDTSGWFDWSSWDAYYELYSVSPNGGSVQAVLSNSGLDQTFTLSTGTYWDQQTTSRRINFRPQEGTASRGIWTNLLMNLAYDFTGPSTAPTKVRLAGFNSAFAPVGQVVQGVNFQSGSSLYTSWDTMYPLWHEYGHNTLYNKTMSQSEFVNCRGLFISCAPDFAPLLNLSCLDPRNFNFNACIGFTHTPENYTYYYAANEGWAEMSHQIMTQWFTTTHGQASGFLNNPYLIGMKYCGISYPCPFADSVIRTQNEYYVGTLFFRLITEAIADWPQQLIKNADGTFTAQNVIPTKSQVDAARDAWRTINSRLPLLNSTQITPFTVVNVIANSYPSKVSTNLSKVCQIIDQMGIPSSERQKFIVVGVMNCG